MAADAAQDVIRKVLHGLCPLDRLPPQSKQVVRIFVSSTFSDTKEERNAFMQHVYPKMSDFCREKYGLEFQVVDMRWGVPEHASENHTTTELCLQEIRKCQEVSAGPNFVAIVGNKYGFRPIPSSLSQGEYAALEAVATGNHDDEWSRVAEWYMRDENCQPPVYVLQPISSKLTHYNDLENPELRKKDQNEWQNINEKLTSCLRKTAKGAAQAGSLTHVQMHKFYMSVTENEISQGLIKSSSAELRDSCLCILRDIQDIQDHLQDPKAPKFIDLDPTGADVDSEARGYLQELRDSKVLSQTPDSCRIQTAIEWDTSGAKISLESLGDVSKVAKYGDRFLHRQSNVSKHQTYLQRLCSRFMIKLTGMVHRAGARQVLLYDAQTKEILEHWHFAKRRCQVFEGREDLLDKAMSYLAGDSSTPLVIYGNSGCGKTSVIAKLASVICDGDHRESSRESGGEKSSVMPQTAEEDVGEHIRVTGGLDPPTGEKESLTNRSAGISPTLASGSSERATNKAASPEWAKDEEASPAPPEVKHKPTGVVTDVSAVSTELKDTRARESNQAPAKPNSKARKNKASTPRREQDIDQQVPFTCLRFLGTTPHTSNVQQLIVSLCQQMSQLSGIAWDEPERFSDLVQSFHGLLGQASKSRRITILLDSLDQLTLAYSAFKLKWLPSTLPANVKVVVSVLDEGYDLLETLKQKYEDQGGQILEVTPIEEDTGLLIIKRWLALLGRGINASQEELTRQALSRCGLPLFARIMFDQVRRWKSYDQPTLAQLETTVKGAIYQLYHQMEVKFGAPLVKHCLAYLTASRHGLSEVEMEHILSLDDILLSKIYNFWKPPIRRIPPLLWTRVRAEISNYIVERSADDVMVLYWYHRQFILATKEKYLSDPTFAVHIHQTMAEFFHGKWGAGRKKPFAYTEAQRKRFNLDGLASAEDRKVPAQPYLVERQDGGGVWYNQRKMSELPFHLLKSKQDAALSRDVFFSFDWLFAKMKSSSMQSLVQELEVFMMADKGIRQDMNVKILYATLQLIKPYVQRFPNSLSYELTGRLAKYTGKYEHITALIKQCDTAGSRYCPVIPLVTCFESAQLGMKQHITIRDSELWHEGGAFTCSRDFRIMYLLDYDQSGDVFLCTWDIENGELLQRLPVQKPRDKGILDLYFSCQLDSHGKLLVAMYRQKYFEGFYKQRYTDKGYADVIEVDTGIVLKVIPGHIYKKGFFNALFYMTDNWVALQLFSKLPLYHLHEETKLQKSMIHRLSPDEKMVIATSNKKIPIKQGGSEGKKQPLRVKSTSLRRFPSKESLGTFDCSEKVDSIVITQDNRRAVLGSLMGTLLVYELDRLGEGKLIKVHATITLPKTERVSVKDGYDQQFKEESGDSDSDNDADGNPQNQPPQKAKYDFKRKKWEEKIAFYMTLILSPDDRYVISCHQGPDHWEAFLWYLGSHSMGTDKSKFVGKLCKKKALVRRHPVFSHDSKHIISSRENTIVVISVLDGSPVREFSFGSAIRDVCPSATSGQVAVLLGREVALFDIGDSTKAEDSADAEAAKASSVHPQQRGGGQRGAGRKQEAGSTRREETTILFGSEAMGNSQILPALKLSSSTAHELLVEEEGASPQDPSGIGSSAVERKVALDTRVTPDGNTVVKLYSHLQVVDNESECIVYTPSPTDTLFRLPPQGGATAAVNGLNQDHSVTGVSIKTALSGGAPNGLGAKELNPGDQFVGGNGRVRLRVTPAQGGRLKLEIIPSMIVVSPSVDTTRRIASIAVYNETILLVTNHSMVTLKKKSSSDFINIYSLTSGKLVTTHPWMGGVGVRCAQVSPTGDKLFLATDELEILMFTGQDFTRSEPRIARTKDGSKARKYTVRDVITFPGNEDRVTLRYNDPETGSNDVTYYVTLDLSSKQYSKPIKVNGQFEDISRDGSLGLDSQLQMRNLLTGDISVRIPYDNAGVNMQIQARLAVSEDHVVFVDKQDDSLHVVALAGRNAVIVSSCCAHAPQLPPYGGFALRQQGRVLTLRGGVNPIIHLIKTTDKDSVFDYSNELGRILSMRPPKLNVIDYNNKVTKPVLKASLTGVTRRKKTKQDSSGMSAQTTQGVPSKQEVIEDVTGHM